ncbi:MULTISPECIES: hypothetical protein [unclassified Streptomyces]|uniref:Uncharacterized protein n=1 Tax=Streptomyces sp. NBC_00060 TaxID=2975636 RepID=A0AAU2H2Z3_9ACTN
MRRHEDETAGGGVAATPVAPAVRGSDPAVDPSDPAVRAPAAGASDPGVRAPAPPTAAPDQPAPPPPADLKPAPLLPTEERDKWALRLHRAVSGFIDEPRQAVEEADAVLGETTARVAELVKERRRSAPDKGDTEELRLALRDYREITERMLEL